MSQNVVWNSKEDKILINFVRCHAELYNVKNKNYRKYQMKRLMWRKIGARLKKPGPECYKRWTYVRDYYIRSGKSGAGACGKAARKRAQLLSFLDSVKCSQQNTPANITNEDDFESIPEEENEITQKIENDNLINPIEDIEDIMNNEGGGHYNPYDDEDSDETSTDSDHMDLAMYQKSTSNRTESEATDLFFQSMSKIVRKLPRFKQTQLRVKIADIVGNAEFRNIPEPLD